MTLYDLRNLPYGVFSTGDGVRRDGPRPLWIGFGSTNVLEPLTELIRLGLINGGYE